MKFNLILPFALSSAVDRRNMTRYTAGLKAAALALVLATALAGCFAGAGKTKPEGGEGGVRDDMMRQERFRTRPPISSRRNLYEGSLWRGASSWGNLMRDHRARYRGDLLTVTDMPKIINLPEARKWEWRLTGMASDDSNDTRAPTISAVIEVTKTADDIWEHVRALLVAADLDQLGKPAWRLGGAKASNRKEHTI